MAGEVPISAGTDFMHSFTAAVSAAYAPALLYGLLTFQASAHAAQAARPAILQCTFAAAKAAAVNAFSQASTGWHEEVLAELKAVLHAAALDSSPQQLLVSQTGSTLQVLLMLCMHVVCGHTSIAVHA